MKLPSLPVQHLPFSHRGNQLQWESHPRAASRFLMSFLIFPETDTGVIRTTKKNSCWYCFHHMRGSVSLTTCCIRMYAFYSVFPSFCKVIHRPRLHRGDWSESNPYFFEESEASLTLTSSVYICQVATLILIESSSIRILLIVDNSFLSIACPTV